MSCQVPWGFGHQVMYLFFIFRHFMYVNNLMYRTRAISGRSQLVAAPLRNHAKRQFLRVFYVTV